jgi:gamma-glutamylcyclotransferase (GGCT)/AIG2-like uncharacterized protein YtfP
MSGQNKTFFFAYGSLRKQARHPMHRVLVRHGIYIGLGVFQGRLYNVGRYPGLVASTSKSDRIVGEVYKLQRHRETFEILDDYEGRLFSRQQATILLETGEVITAWLYLYRGAVEEDRRILSGDYVTYINRSS